MPSTVLHEKCPTCGKTAKAMFDTLNKEGTKHITVLQCGHTISVDLAAAKDFNFLKFSDGKKPYKFQVTSMEFARNANFNCGIFHQMGLGKTIIAAGILNYYLEDLKPILILCKSSLVLNWQREMIRVCGPRIHYIPYHVDDPMDAPSSLFPISIMSLDLLRSYDKDELGEFHPKTIILDECQMIKNPGAKRTQSLRILANGAKHIMLLSGTPIKRNAAEYFTALNLLNPTMFYQEAAYLRRYVFFDGKRYRGLQNPKEFQDKTKNFIIRYERKDPEVDVELPDIDRQYKYMDLTNDVKKAYDDELTKFEKEYDEYQDATGAKKTEAWSNVLAYMSVMREITGLAKVPFILDHVIDFIEQNPDEKLVIFLHHHSVANNLEIALRPILKEKELRMPLSLVGMSGEQRGLKAIEFQENPDIKLLIGTVLASGEGLNLQTCGYCVIGEREWNPGDEEQAECRFVRIGSNHPRVQSTYPIAIGTIDELLIDITEKKRKNLQSTLSYQTILQWDESEVLQELAAVIRKKGRQSLWKAPTAV